MRNNPLRNDATMLFQRGMEEKMVPALWRKQYKHSLLSSQRRSPFEESETLKNAHLTLKDLSWTLNYLLCNKAQEELKAPTCCRNYKPVQIKQWQ